MSLKSMFVDIFSVDQPSLSTPVLMKLATTRKQPAAAPSRDEFAAWRDDPVTQFVMNALEHNTEECRDEWLRLSWEGGKADQRSLDALRERSDALLGFTADYEAFCETLGLEPEQEEQAA